MLILLFFNRRDAASVRPARVHGHHCRDGRVSQRPGRLGAALGLLWPPFHHDLYSDRHGCSPRLRFGLIITIIITTLSCLPRMLKRGTLDHDPYFSVTYFISQKAHCIFRPFCQCIKLMRHCARRVCGCGDAHPRHLLRRAADSTDLGRPLPQVCLPPGRRLPQGRPGGAGSECIFKLLLCLLMSRTFSGGQPDVSRS